MNFANKVKYRRMELGLSQQDLANKMGYSSRSSINKIEKGRQVSKKIIDKLAVALDTTPNYFDCDQDYLKVKNMPELMSKNIEETIQYLLENSTEELLELYKKIIVDQNLVLLVKNVYELSPKDIEHILRIIDTFKKEIDM